MRYFKALLLILSLLVIAYVVYAYRKDFTILKRISTVEILLLCLPALFNIFIQSFQFNAILRMFKVKFDLGGMTAITSVTALYNNIVPLSGGAAVRSLLLKKLTGIEWSEVASVMSGYYLLSYLSMGGSLILASSIVFISGDISASLYYATLVLFGITLLLFNLLLRKTIALNGQNRIVEFINSSFSGLRQFKNKKELQFQIIALQLIIVLLAALKLYWCFLFLDFDCSFWKVFVVQSFVVFSMFISITPGNLGVQEGLFVLFAPFLEVSPENMFVAALLFRITNIVVILAAGLLAKLWLMKK